MGKISNKQLALNMEKMIGKRVLILSGNHKDERGITSRVLVREFFKPAIMVKLDSGVEIQTKSGQLMYLVIEGGKRIDDFPEHLSIPPELKGKIEEIKNSPEWNKTKIDD